MTFGRNVINQSDNWTVWRVGWTKRLLLFDLHFRHFFGWYNWRVPWNKRLSTTNLFFGPIWFSDSIRVKWIFGLIQYSACKRLGTSGSNLKNLFHEKCRKCRSNNNNRFVHPTRQTVRFVIIVAGSKFSNTYHHQFLTSKKLKKTSFWQNDADFSP